MYLSDSIVTCVNVMNCWLIPMLGNYNNNNNNSNNFILIVQIETNTDRSSIWMKLNGDFFTVRVSFMVMGGLGAETESLVGDMEVDMVV